MIDLPCPQRVHRSLAGHDVEAEAAGLSWMLAQPRGASANQSRPLRGADGQLGRTEGGRAARLHLDEGDECSAADDQIDLDSGHPDVAVDDAIPSGCQKLRGACLPFRTEGAAVILHVWGISAGPGDGGV